MGRRAKGPREDLVPPEGKAEGKAGGKAEGKAEGKAGGKARGKAEAKARPAAVRQVSVGRGARAEGSVDRVDRVVRHREDRRRVDLAVAGAQGWAPPARSGLWSAPCRSTLTATASSIATN